MRYKQVKSSYNSGFTIIEVLVVLAIAGLILMILFLAVPALQRNSRNNARKNDAAVALAAIKRFSNRSNRLPDQVTSPAAGRIRFECASGCSTSETTLKYFNGGVGEAAGQVEYTNPYQARGAYDAASDDRLSIVVGARCSETVSGQTETGAANQIAAVFMVENGVNSYIGACQAL